MLSKQIIVRTIGLLAGLKSSPDGMQTSPCHHGHAVLLADTAALAMLVYAKQPCGYPYELSDLTYA